MRKVLVGISGGVDSSVTALLLKNEGYEVEGILFKQVSEPADCDDYVCCAETAISRARDVCDQLGIHLHTPDVRDIFTKKVINPAIALWEQGAIPSPCTTCNADVRGPLLNYYRQVFECDHFATGHYFINEGGRIYRGVDPKKDQSYMVSLVDRQLLNLWLTPLGRLSKSEVRKIATEAGIPTATTPDSQNLCFNHLLPDFNRDIFKRSGDNALIKIGSHSGRPAVGQRKGFGGNTVVEVSKDAIVVGDTANRVRDIRVLWKVKPEGAPSGTSVQVVYHGTNHAVSDWNDARVSLVTPQVVNAGQVVAVYRNDELIGGGVICQIQQQISF